MNSSAAIAAAYHALSPAPATLAAAVATLNAQRGATPSVPSAAVPVAQMHRMLLMAPAGDWARIEWLTAQPYSATWPATPDAQDRLIVRARRLVSLAHAEASIAHVRPAEWAAVLADLTALSAAGHIAAAMLTALEGLPDFSAPPVWTPALTIGDLQTALGAI